MSAAARARSLRPAPRALRLGLTPVARRTVLGALGRIEGGALALALPDGTERRFGDPLAGRTVRARIESDDLFRRLARRGRIGLGEAYVAGDWASDDLVGVLELLVENAHRAAGRPPWSTIGRAVALRPRLPRARGLARARRDVAYHYDLGNDLFRLFLDETLTYSCAYFEHPEQSLADGQRSKYRVLCEKLAIGPEDRVLEIGCGFGGFALYAAAERGARVTATTISPAQLELARARVRDAGLEARVEIVERDYRRLEGSYSKIVSIEMLEAVGERGLEPFFAACDRLLAPDGLVGVQTIVVPDQRYARYRRSTDWIREYVFPGSHIPSLSAVTRAATEASSLLVQGLEEIGIGYAETLRRWRERFLAARDEVLRLGYDEHFVRTWDFYLASCEALFRTRSLRDVQLVLTRPFNRALPRYPSVRTTFS